MLYKLGKVLFSIYFFIFNKVIVHGCENIPNTGGFVLCSNHIHWLDPLLMGAYIKRNINFMAKAELFKSKFFAIILNGINAFPVKRGSPDISAIKTSLKIIKNGHVLGIFPEGTRSKDGNLKPAEPGVALIALKAQAPVIPMRIKGNYRPGGKLLISIGKPIEFGEQNSKKLSMDEMIRISQNIMDEIGKLA
jgi:1-acyl-sn-glycerol-3-phosphate acyltransferase